MNSGIAEPGASEGKQAAEEWLRYAEQAESRSARYEELANQAQAISVTESSELATVTVDVSGVVIGLELIDDLGGRSGSRVAAAVLATMRQAQARLAERMADLAAATVGPDDRVGTGMTGRLRDRFGDPPADRARPGADDEEPGDGSIMRRSW